MSQNGPHDFQMGGSDEPAPYVPKLFFVCTLMLFKIEFSASTSVD